MKLTINNFYRTSEITKELIDAGYASQTGSQLRALAKSEPTPLLLSYVKENDKFAEINAELDARMRWHGSHKPIKKPKWI